MYFIYNMTVDACKPRLFATIPRIMQTDNKNVTTEGVEIVIGQVWRDLDRRMGDRYCKVMSLYDGYAKMRRCTDAGTEFGTKDTRVAVRRMHKGAAGWELTSQQVPMTYDTFFAECKRRGTTLQDLLPGLIKRCAELEAELLPEDSKMKQSQSNNQVK